MTKQEIKGLKVGDEIIFVDCDLRVVSKIEKISFSKKDSKIILILADNIGCYYEDDLLDETYSIKQQTKKNTYTLETFPENALWIRHKEWEKGEKATFSLRVDYNGNIRVWFFDCLQEENFEIDDFKKIENYEIGCQIIKDGKIEIEWKNFYIEE